MKVSELILILQTLSPELDVYVSDWNEDWAGPSALLPHEVGQGTVEVWDEVFNKTTVMAVLIK